MTATEPLTHVRVHGRHLFIPYSLADPTFRCVDGSDNDEVHLMTDALTREDGNGGDVDQPTAEERLVLHRLLTAVVLSATCRCNAMGLSLSGKMDFEDDWEGVKSRTVSTISTEEEMQHEGLQSRGATTVTAAAAAAAGASPPVVKVPVRPCTCAKAQTVACAVGVILLSCALLRTAFE